MKRDNTNVKANAHEVQEGSDVGQRGRITGAATTARLAPAATETVSAVSCTPLIISAVIGATLIACALVFEIDPHHRITGGMTLSNFINGARSNDSAAAAAVTREAALAALAVSLARQAEVPGAVRASDSVTRASGNNNLKEDGASMRNDDTGTRWQRGRNQSHRANAEPERQKLLIVVFGLMRTFKQTWPTMRPVVKGFDQVDLIVSTSVTQRCSSTHGRLCRDEFTRPNNDDYRGSIFDTYVQHGVKMLFFYHNATLHNEERILAGIDAAARIRRRIPRDELLNKYDTVLIIRPDVQFTSSSVDLKRLCSNHPGFNLISGDFERQCFWHNRDTDYGFLACDPKSLVHYFEPKASCTAHGACSNPPLPDGFTGSWDNPGCTGQGPRACDTSYCNKAKDFVDENTRLGNLDDEKVFLAIIR